MFINISGVFSKVGELDRESVSKITVNISATDNGNPPKSTYTTVEVTVLDFNDNAPNFVNFTERINIREDTPNGSHILDVIADDKDIGPNANLTFSLENDFDGKFLIKTAQSEMNVSLF